MVTKAHATKQECDTAVENATNAEKEAKEAKNAKIVELNTQTTEEGKLVENTEKLAKDHADVQFGLDTVQAESISAKDAKKLSQILTGLEEPAPEALVLGLPTAVGKDDDFNKQFVAAAVKILDTAMASVQGKEFDWKKHTDEMAAKTKILQDEVTALTAAHEERAKELAECKTNQKTAVQGVKDTEATQKKGTAKLAKLEKEKEAAELEVTKAAEVYADYEFLFEQTAVVEEPVFEPETEETTEEQPAATEETTEELPAPMETTEEPAAATEEVTEEQPFAAEIPDATEEQPAPMDVTEEVTADQDAAMAVLKLAAEAPLPGVEDAAFADVAGY